MQSGFERKKNSCILRLLPLYVAVHIKFGVCMHKDVSDLIRKIDVDPRYSHLILEALTHKSYSTEHSLSYDNQRFEFLGDAVMQIVLTEYLFTRYPSEQEGKLTKMRSALARQSSFAKLAKTLDLQDYV